MSIENNHLRVTMPDGSKWDVPVTVIARHRAEHYATDEDFGGDVEKSLKEDTIPLFECDDYDITDWAANNMNWEDVVENAVKFSDQDPMSDENFQEGWVNGEKEIVEK